jgi:hypothetical protein
LNASLSRFLFSFLLRQLWIQTPIHTHTRTTHFLYNSCIGVDVDETHLAHVKSLADAEYYRVTRQAEANQKQLTQEYLFLELIRSLSNNTKIYFGPSVHNMFLDLMQHIQQILASNYSQFSIKPPN